MDWRVVVQISVVWDVCPDGERNRFWLENWLQLMYKKFGSETNRSKALWIKFGLILSIIKTVSQQWANGWSVLSTDTSERWGDRSDAYPGFVQLSQSLSLGFSSHRFSFIIQRQFRWWPTIAVVGIAGTLETHEETNKTLITITTNRAVISLIVALMPKIWVNWSHCWHWRPQWNDSYIVHSVGSILWPNGSSEPIDGLLMTTNWL